MIGDCSELAQNIWSVPLLSATESAAVVGMLRAELDWKPAKVGGRNGESVVRPDIRHCATVPAKRYISIEPLIWHCLQQFASRLNLDLPRFELSETTIVRYNAGGFYVLHTDSGGSSSMTVDLSDVWH